MQNRRCVMKQTFKKWNSSNLCLYQLWVALLHAWSFSLNWNQRWFESTRKWEYKLGYKCSFAWGLFVNRWMTASGHNTVTVMMSQPLNNAQYDFGRSYFLTRYSLAEAFIRYLKNEWITPIGRKQILYLDVSLVERFSLWK